MARTSSIHVYDHLYLYLTSLTLTLNLPKNVSNGTSPPQGQQLCQFVLKSMHYCTSYGLDKSGRTHARMHRRTHIHQTKIVRAMSRLPASGLDKNVSNGTTTPQGEHLYEIILQSMHKCRSYGPDKLIYVTFKCDLALQST